MTSLTIATMNLWQRTFSISAPTEIVKSKKVDKTSVTLFTIDLPKNESDWKLTTEFILFLVFMKSSQNRVSHSRAIWPCNSRDCVAKCTFLWKLFIFLSCNLWIFLFPLCTGTCHRFHIRLCWGCSPWWLKLLGEMNLFWSSQFLLSWCIPGRDRGHRLSGLCKLTSLNETGCRRCFTLDSSLD